MADGPVAEALLRRLEAADGGLDSAELAAELGVEHQVLVGTVKSLQALGEVSRTRDAWPPGFRTCSSRVRRALTPGHTASGLGRVNCVFISGCAGGEPGTSEGPGRADVPPAGNVC